MTLGRLAQLVLNEPAPGPGRRQPTSLYHAWRQSRSLQQFLQGLAPGSWTSLIDTIRDDLCQAPVPEWVGDLLRSCLASDKASLAGLLLQELARDLSSLSAMCEIAAATSPGVTFCKDQLRALLTGPWPRSVATPSDSLCAVMIAIIKGLGADHVVRAIHSVLLDGAEFNAQSLLAVFRLDRSELIDLPKRHIAVWLDDAIDAGECAQVIGCMRLAQAFSVAQGLAGSGVPGFRYSLWIQKLVMNAAAMKSPSSERRLRSMLAAMLTSKSSDWVESVNAHQAAIGRLNSHPELCAAFLAAEKTSVPSHPAHPAACRCLRHREPGSDLPTSPGPDDVILTTVLNCYLRYVVSGVTSVGAGDMTGDQFVAGIEHYAIALSDLTGPLRSRLVSLIHALLGANISEFQVAALAVLCASGLRTRPSSPLFAQLLDRLPFSDRHNPILFAVHFIRSRSLVGVGSGLGSDPPLNVLAAKLRYLTERHEFAHSGGLSCDTTTSRCALFAQMKSLLSTEVGPVDFANIPGAQILELELDQDGSDSGWICSFLKGRYSPDSAADAVDRFVLDLVGRIATGSRTVPPAFPALIQAWFRLLPTRSLPEFLHAAQHKAAIPLSLLLRILDAFAGHLDMVMLEPLLLHTIQTSPGFITRLAADEMRLIIWLYRTRSATPPRDPQLRALLGADTGRFHDLQDDAVAICIACSAVLYPGRASTLFRSLHLEHNRDLAALLLRRFALDGDFAACHVLCRSMGSIEPMAVAFPDLQPDAAATLLRLALASPDTVSRASQNPDLLHCIVRHFMWYLPRALNHITDGLDLATSSRQMINCILERTETPFPDDLVRQLRCPAMDAS